MMKGVLPALLQRKLRSYRFVYWNRAVAETICLGTALALLLNPPAALLALPWLAWKYLRNPSNRALAATIETRHPHLRDKLTAAVELAESPDPPAVKGSPDMLCQLYAEVDRDIVPIDFTRLVSLKPLVTFLIVAGAAVVIGSHSLRQTTPPPPAPTTHPPVQNVSKPIEKPPDPSKLMARLKQLAAALANTPEDVLRSLPPYARSLDGAISAANKAAAARAMGDFSEAQALGQNVAETLSELARLLAQFPELAALAREAGQLAEQFARAALPTTMITTTGVSPGPGVTATTGVTTTIRTPTGVLPATAPGGPAWSPSVASADSSRFVSSSPEYEQQIRSYFERIATFTN